MSKRIINPKSTTNKYLQGISKLSAHYREPLSKLTRHLLDEHGYTLEQIGAITDTSKQAISKNWLREESTNE